MIVVYAHQQNTMSVMISQVINVGNHIWPDYLPYNDADFGYRVDARAMYKTLVKSYVLNLPLNTVTYYNSKDKIFSCRLGAFRNVIGFGATTTDALSDALDQLGVLRESYGSLNDSEISVDAREFRDRLNLYLSPRWN